MPEFAEGDVIVCIGDTERWVVWDVGTTVYEVRRLAAFGDCGDLSKVVAHAEFVKVGKYKFAEGKEAQDVVE